MPTHDARRQALLEILARSPVMPVVTIERAEDAVPLAQALVRGGIHAIEITLRTDAALTAARAIIKAVPEAIVGLGTVLTPLDLLTAEEVGARFALSPGATPALLDAARRSNVPFMPGIATPSELMQALEAGFDVVKLFPAVPLGGLATLRALAAPFPQMRFCPTGGLTESTAAEWLAEPSVVALGGSWIAPAKLVREGNFREIEERARKAALLSSR